MRPPARRGWVLYDGECAFCVRWLQFWSPVLRRRGFEIDTLQAEWTQQALGIPRDEVLRDIRLLTTTGETQAGANVYLYIARRIWWAWPFGVLFGLPGFNRLIWTGYRWFAKNRQCVSGYCVSTRIQDRSGKS
jgi:predicted DCC family thiol-disulfide oxidoreductase YuxK